MNLGADSKGKRPAVAVRYFSPLVCARTNERKQQTEQVNREGTTIVEKGGDMVVGGIIETGENVVGGGDDTGEAAQGRTVGFYKCA